MPDGFLDDMPDLELPVSKPKQVNPAAKNRPEKSAQETEILYPAVIYAKIKCPKCKSENCPVTSTVRPVRYHKCLECGLTFKSIEK